MTLTKKHKLIIAIAAAAVVLAAGLVVALVLLRPGGERFAVVYARGSRNLYVAVPEGTFSLRAQESRQQIFGGGGRYLLFDSVTEHGLNLYACLLRDASSRRMGGTRIAEDIAEYWAVSASGRQVVFVQRSGRRLFVHDIGSQTAQELADQVQALYAAPGQNVFFFTKREGDASVLFRAQVGRQPERMTGTVTQTRFFYDEQQAIVFYTAGGSLFALAQSGGPVLVAENPAQVLFEAYEAGGNLYFLKETQPGQGLAFVLDDPYAQSDAAMTEPQAPERPGGLTGWLTDFFGAGETAYQREREAWNARQRREQTRSMARRVLEDIPMAAALMELYVYDGTGTQRLAEGISPEGIVALRPRGRAAALFGKQQVTAEGQATITLEALQGHYSQGGEEAVREYLYAIAGGSQEFAGWSIAMMTERGANEIPLDRAFGGGAEWSANFLQAPDSMLYLENNVEGAQFALFVYDLMEFGLSERRFLAAEVTEAAVGAMGMYFRRQEIGGTRGALYFYHSGAQAQRVLNNVGAFFFTPDRATLLVLSDIREDSGTLHASVNQAARPIGQNVRIGSVRAGHSHTGFIANWQEGAGELWVSDLNRPARKLHNGVTEILAVN